MRLTTEPAVQRAIWPPTRLVASPTVRPAIRSTIRSPTPSLLWGRCATVWPLLCAWWPQLRAPRCSSATPWAAASPPRRWCATPAFPWQGSCWKAPGSVRPTMRPARRWHGAMGNGPHGCAREAWRPSWTGGRRCPCSPPSGSCPRPPALPSASVARPTTQKPSLVPWRLGVRTIRRRKARLRLLSPKCEWPVVQFSIWRGLATRNTLPSPPAFALPVFLPSSWKVPVTMFTWKSPRYSQGPLRSLQGHPLRALCPRSARRWRDWSCFLAWNSRPWSQNGAKGRTL